jgi:hypothetical protein
MAMIGTHLALTYTDNGVSADISDGTADAHPQDEYLVISMTCHLGWRSCPHLGGHDFLSQ